MTVEHCARCATEERPQVVYLTVKDLAAAGAPDPLAARFASLFKPRWSAGQRDVISQVELQPNELAALAESFPELKRTIDADPVNFADAQAARRELGIAHEGAGITPTERVAQIKPVPAPYGGTVLTRGNAMVQAFIRLLILFGGLGAAFGPAAVIYNLDPKPPDWVFGVAAGWLMLCLLLNMFWNLLYPTYLTSRFMVRQARQRV